MSKIWELTEYLESIAPLHLQEDYDNAGLIVGNPDTEISGVLISLDCIESIIDEAIEKNCNVVVSHHPIVFSGMKRFNGSDYVQRTVMKAIRHDIALYAIHTNLDNVLNNGVNQKIANRLHLKNQTILKPKDLEKYGPQIGSGVIGQLERPMNTIAFLELLKTEMQIPTFRHTSLVHNHIEKVAVCGGSGRFLLPEAINAGAQILITSDFKYHEFFDTNNEIIIADIGHYESERFTIDLLFQLITNKFRNFASHCTKINTNPVKYF